MFEDGFQIVWSRIKADDADIEDRDVIYTASSSKWRDLQLSSMCVNGKELSQIKKTIIIENNSSQWEVCMLPIQKKENDFYN